MTSRQSNQFPIPEGFPEILHDFAKEVVRYQPNDIYDFSIQYFNCLENEIPLQYIPGGSSNIEHKEEIKQEKSVEDEKQINDNQINEINNINNDNVNESVHSSIGKEESAREFVDDVFKKSFHYVKNSQEFKDKENENENQNENENENQNEEDEKSKKSKTKSMEENNLINENMILNSENNNERGNEENVILGQTIMNTQGSETNSRAFSSSSISNNSELRRTAHQFIGDVFRNGNEELKKNKDNI